MKLKGGKEMNNCEKCGGTQPCKCQRGPRGPRGYQGFTGLDGEQGETGKQGVKGDRGPRGYEGQPGLVGERGEKGEPGEQGPEGDQGPQGIQGIQGIKGDTGPAGPINVAYGFAYTESGSSENGSVKFSVATPLQDVEPSHEGLVIGIDGIYQISYKVLLVSKAITCVPSKFHIEINDKIKVSSSLTESTTANTLTSSLLLSLQEGDLVKLVAELQENFSYKLATLQLVRVG